VIDDKIAGHGEDPTANLAFVTIKLVHALEKFTKNAGCQVLSICPIGHATGDKSVHIGVELAVETDKCLGITIARTQQVICLPIIL